jgi:hypothetical protein
MLWYLDYIALNDRNTDELERTWKEVVMVKLRYHPRIFLQRQMKTIMNFEHDSWCPCQERHLQDISTDHSHYTNLFGERIKW